MKPTFLFCDYDPCVFWIVGQIIIEAQAVLVDHGQCGVLCTRKRGDPGLVSVNDAACLGVLHVQPTVDVERCGFRNALATDHIALHCQA